MYFIFPLEKPQFELTTKPKNNNLFDSIPVSIITGVGDDTLVAKAFEFPIVDIIRKPFNERDVKLVLDKTIYFNDQL